MGRAVPPEPRLLASPEELRLHLIRLPEASIPAALKAAGEGPAFCRPLSPLLPQAPSRLKYPEERLEAWLRSLASHEGRPVVYIGHLTDYAACPRKFWYGHILGIQPEPEADAQWSSRDQGTLLHSVLEEFLAPLAGLKPGERPPGLVSSRRLIGIFREKAREAENLAEMVSEEGEDRAPERPGKAAKERKTGSLGRLPVFRDSLAKLERALLRWHFREDGFPHEILAVEWRFGRGKSRRGEAAADGAQARGGAPSAPPLKVESESGAFYMEGRLDRVDRLPDGGLRVIDYKMRHSGYYAGKPKPEALSPSAGGFPLRPVGIRVSHCQLLVYRLAAERYLLGRASARYEFMSPPHEKSFIEGDPGGPEVLSALWENLLERHTEPADGLTDEATCAYCDYARLCGRRRA
ncbi:MAG: PD-(D/E)XK nuclease family protein [Deltaproteobacteria bacterium]|nr:PD-(D/E)XK nuclease family protein [Deltaproteobacteria bacterium]